MFASRESRQNSASFEEEEEMTDPPVGQALGRAAAALAQQVIPDYSTGGNTNAKEEQGQFRYVHDMQAKHTVGMECYGTALYYMLKSYGVIDPKLTRTQFEKMYTRINGNVPTVLYDGTDDVFTHYYRKLKTTDISRLTDNGKVNSANKGKIYSAQQAAEFALRGMDYISGIVKSTTDLQFYLNAFSEMRSRDNKSYRESSYGAKKFSVSNLDLGSGNLNAVQLQQDLKNGNTAFVGIDLTNAFLNERGSNTTLSMGHRVVVTHFLESVVFEGSAESLSIYLADDPWYGEKIFVLDRQVPYGAKIKGQDAKTYLSNRAAGIGCKSNDIYVFAEGVFSAKRK